MSDTYRHFKGNYYRVVLFAVDSNTEQPVVVYESLKDGRIWTRPHAEFFGTVERGGLVHQRFTPVSEQEVEAWKRNLDVPAQITRGGGVLFVDGRFIGEERYGAAPKED